MPIRRDIMDATLARWTMAKSLDAVPRPKPWTVTATQARDPDRITAMCADYRAGATTDRAIDEADRAAGRKIVVPLRFLWARGGFPAQTGDPGAIWRRWADDVQDSACDSGHFAMEENPQAVLEAFMPFFRA